MCRPRRCGGRVKAASDRARLGSWHERRETCWLARDSERACAQPSSLKGRISTMTTTTTAGSEPTICGGHCWCCALFQDQDRTDPCHAKPDFEPCAVRCERAAIWRPVSSYHPSRMLQQHADSRLPERACGKQHVAGGRSRPRTGPGMWLRGAHPQGISI
ncbi:hypothetical protein B0T24DRAFT_613534 [Lasiosphaeria ovina]|uniref:Uncharacterized protein n=1 Tax=Lasiosphaeria ovina TaxID=92902 RepID=A0AAE0TTU9_9PEZI|nr:hypothetical protein B0T24DRAFT_613534 [Lasiosphaeria ovina]